MSRRVDCVCRGDVPHCMLCGGKGYTLQDDTKQAEPEGSDSGEASAALPQEPEDGVAVPVSATPPRSTDPGTSYEAMRSVSDGTIKATYRLILVYLAESGPSTDEALTRWVENHGVGSPSGTRTRRDRLVEAGCAVAAGKVPGSTGRRMTQWAITARGRDYLREQA